MVCLFLGAVLFSQDKVKCFSNISKLSHDKVLKQGMTISALVRSTQKEEGRSLVRPY